MTRLREYWLETLATCVTALLLAYVYGVLAGYASGPKGTHSIMIAEPAPQPGRLAGSSLQ